VRRRLSVLVLPLLALVATSCAIPTQSTPSTMSPSKVPFGLLNPHPPTTTTTTQPKPASFSPVTVYFLNSTAKLTGALRYVAAPAPLDAVIRAMLAGPFGSETSQGITTAIPSDVALLSVVPPQNNIVTVNMNTAFGTITGNNTELAVAQIVATVVADTGPNTGVIFEIDGQRTSVPIANGSQVSTPVYLLDFLGGPA
jgi:spore germination protein GerM